MVEHFKRVSAHVVFDPLLCGNYAILIATFASSFTCFGHHSCDLQLKEQGRNSFLIICDSTFLARFG